MIKIFLRDGTTKEIKGAQIAELVAVTSEQVVVKEDTYTSKSLATFLRSEVVGWAFEEDIKEEGE